MDKYINLNISEYFNHKCFLERKEIMLTNGLANQGLGLDSNFFVSTGYPESMNIAKIVEIPFAFPDKHSKVYDNIECHGQILPVPEHNYRKIHIIGFSHLGSYSGDLFLHYGSEKFEKICIKFLEWSIAGRMNAENIFKFDNKIFFGNETPVLFGKATDDLNVACTYYFDKVINSDSIMTHICLPDNEFMHVLAITLEK